jgi:tetratricopeptide (TPR) repeat protein
MAVDEEYMRHEHVSTLDDWNYAHNLSYLIASDAEAGRYHEALEFAEKLDKVPANPFLALGRPTHAITIGSTTARLQLRFGNWQAVIDHPVILGDPALAGPPAIAFRDGVIAYARGMQALENKQLTEAARQADALDALQWRLNADREDSSDDNDDDEPGGKPDRVLSLLETASLDLRGNLACAQGNMEQGLKLLQLAIKKEEGVGYSEPPQYGRPELESAGYAYLQAGQFDKARETFQAELKLRPRSGHALYGIALSYEKAGKPAEARKAYDEFLMAWTNADPDLPMMRHAKSLQ